MTQFSCNLLHDLALHIVIPNLHKNISEFVTKVNESGGQDFPLCLEVGVCEYVTRGKSIFSSVICDNTLEQPCETLLNSILASRMHCAQI